jgi:hypothetical protein
MSALGALADLSSTLDPMQRSVPATNLRRRRRRRTQTAYRRSEQSTLDIPALEDTATPLDPDKPSTLAPSTAIRTLRSRRRRLGVASFEPSRDVRVAEILLRRATAELLNLLTSGPDGLFSLDRFISSSPERLRTFSDMVAEDLLTLDEGQFVLTPYAERSIRELAAHARA